MKNASPQDMDVVEVRIRGLMMDPVTSMPMIVLKDIGGDAVLPIWVGIFEANAIAIEIEKNTTPRPMTHDLIRNLLRGFGANVTRVVITELLEETFYAVIWMERGGEVMAIDARPSDALAVAMRADCPIYVARAVLENAKAGNAAKNGGSSDELRQWLENLNDDDLGKYKM